MTIPSISTQELIEKLDHPEIVLIDTRPPAAYNGWKLRGEARGGHLPGAVSFPISWVEQFSRTQIESLLALKQITNKKTAVLYGDTDDSLSSLADILTEHGLAVSTYKGGIQAWAADAGLPMEHLPNYHKLVHPKWVQQLLSGETTEHPPSQDFALLEVAFDKEEEVQSGHIPGAVYFDLSKIEDPESWNISPDEDLFTFLAGLGLTAESAVVLYGRDVMPTARAALTLMYAGVQDVRILDGGFDSWVRAGYEVESTPNLPQPAASFGRTTPAHPEMILGLQQVKIMLAEREGLLVSVRSWEEYLGEISAYEYFQTRGRIPGAVWGFSGSGPHDLQDFRNPDNTMRSYHEIADNWLKNKITGDQQVIFYCATGWRASETFLYAHLMGWPQIAVYDGGWFEWSQDPANPFESGEPEPDP